MDTSTVIILFAIIGVLLLTLGFMIWLYRRRNDQWAAAQDATQSRHEEATSVLQTAHTRELASAEHRRTLDLASTSAEHQEDLRRRDSELAHATTVRDRAVRLAATGLKWELASRQALVASCKAAKLDAVIATNIVFTPVDSTDTPYCAQIDHLVITDNAVLLVDSKRWKGLIFDGKRPSTLAAPLAMFLNERELPSSYVIKFAKQSKGSSKIDIFTELGADSPAVRARLQARRFNEFLSAGSGTPPYIQTCVFYSHPNSTLIANNVDRGENNVHTHIASITSLADVLARVNASTYAAPRAEQITHILDTVRALGADLVGTGRFASTYESPIPLLYKKRPGKPTSTARSARRTSSSWTVQRG